MLLVVVCPNEPASVPPRTKLKLSDGWPPTAATRANAAPAANPPLPCAPASADVTGATDTPVGPEGGGGGSGAAAAPRFQPIASKAVRSASENGSTVPEVANASAASGVRDEAQSPASPPDLVLKSWRWVTPPSTEK